MIEYHPVVQKTKNLLDKHDCQYECFEHAAVRTSEEAAALRPEYTLSQGTKALIVRTKQKVNGQTKKDFVQIVVPGDAKFDPKKAREVLGVKDIRFATPEEVGEITEGVLPGGVPPFGNLFNISVYADKSVFQHQKVIFNAGDKRYSIAMKSADYQSVVGPQVVRVV